MGVQVEQIDDMIKATREAHLGQKTIKTIFADQSYLFSDQLYRKDRVIEETGKDIQFDIMLHTADNARRVRLYGTDEYKVPKLLEKGTVPWRHATTNWTMDTREANMQQDNAKRLVDMMKARRVASLIALTEILEADAWSKPATSADDLTPFGLTYWVVKGATANEGFIGGNPTGFTDCGGIDSEATGNEGWKNYSARGAGYYTAWDATFINTLRRAWMNLNFKAPVMVQDLVENPRLMDFRMYTTQNAILGMTALAETRNDNLGFDFFNDNLSFNKTPFLWAPKLDSDTTDPVYMLDHDQYRSYVLKGEHFVESSPHALGDQHKTRAVDVDISHNTVCTNRRKQGVLSK